MKHFLYYFLVTLIKIVSFIFDLQKSLNLNLNVILKSLGSYEARYLLLID